MNFTINGEFPTLNEIVKVAKSHHMKYANQKKDYTALTMVQTNRVPKIDFKGDWVFTWYRKNKRNDPDNIQAGTKYIYDGLVKAGIIENDGWEQINSITHQFKVDKENPRVEVMVLQTLVGW